MARFSSLLLLSLALGAEAFAPTSSARRSMAAKSLVEDEIAEFMVDMPVKPTKSVAIPWFERPVGLNSYDLPGDYGFDPLNIAKTKEDLIKYREMEIKHCRLAMLAAAGWPLAELYDKPLAGLIGASSPIAENNGLSPSTLNGGLGLVSPFYWGAVLAGAAAIELVGEKLKGNTKADDYLPGDFSFDPLGVYPKDISGQYDMQVKELKNGRVAMVAIAAFVAQEFVSDVPVVREWPFFFEPIWTFLFKDLGTFDLSRGYIEY